MELRFSFCAIDLLDEDVDLPIKAVRAISRYREFYMAHLKSDNERLKRLWETDMAYTVHLNMQEYLWDGIKETALCGLETCTLRLQPLTAFWSKRHDE